MDKNPNISEQAHAAKDSPTPEAINPKRMAEVMAEGDGVWRTCSGCHESEDGHDIGFYPHSDAFGCKLGGGCGECGGIGAIWDTTDYEEMGRFLSTHHHEAGGAPGQEEIVARACDYWFERARHLADEAGYDYTPPEPGSEYDAHFRESMSGLVSLIASLVPPSDQQGREQVIGELCAIIEKHEQGENHDEGAFDADCSVCRILADLRALSRARSAAQ